MPAVQLANAHGIQYDAITGQLETIRGEQAPATRFDSRTAGVPQIGNPKRRRRKKSSGTTNGESS